MAQTATCDDKDKSETENDRGKGKSYYEKGEKKKAIMVAVDRTKIGKGKGDYGDQHVIENDKGKKVEEGLVGQSERMGSQSKSRYKDMERDLNWANISQNNNHICKDPEPIPEGTKLKDIDTGEKKKKRNSWKRRAREEPRQEGNTH